MGRPRDDAPTCVYYCWHEDELLYIGTTRCLERRQAHHLYASRWWRYVDQVDVEWFDSRRQAEFVERGAIARYRPTFNSFYHYALPIRADDPTLWDLA